MIGPRAWVAGQITLLVAIVVVGSGPTFPTPWWSRAAAVVLVLTGFALAVAAARELGPAFTPAPAPNGIGELCATGPFRRVRHPTYLGVLIAYLGIAVFTGTWIRIELWLVMVVFFNLKVRYEERLMQQAFLRYRDYAATTGRFLPRRGGPAQR